MQNDPFSNYVAESDKGSIVKGIVISVDAKSATIKLADDVEAVLKASEISKDKVEDARNVLKEGDEVEAKIISVDRKNRAISLSIKSKDTIDDEKEVVRDQAKKEEPAASPTTIGDLIKAQMNQNQ
jgi:small subunit ribosomal protein S1